MSGERIGGLRVYVVPTWVRAWLDFGPPLRPPSRAIGRWGTRKMWKRRYNRRRGWRCVPVEPDHVQMTADMLICTPAQYTEIKRRSIPA